MKYILYIAMLMANASSYSPSDLETEMEWCDHKELTWQDFNGVPDDYSHFSAVTATYIEEAHGCDEAGNFAYAVKAVFVKNQSWSIDKYSEALLNHEQVHFDLTEIYARKLRKIFQNLPNPCQMPQEDIMLVLEEFYEELELAHELYDEATRHGLHKGNQRMWNKFVEQKLKNYDAYTCDEYTIRE